MKKLLLTFGIFLLILAGCSEGKSSLPESRYEIDETEPMYSKNVDHNAELTWFVGLDWYDPEWGRDLATQEITTQTGMTVEFIVGTEDQLNTMIASGDTPDLVSIDSASNLNQNAEEWAISLNDLSDQYSPYFLSNLADETLLKYYQQENGNTYGYTSYAYNESYDIYPNTAMYVREDIYKAIGEPDLTTPEGFLTALRDAQEFQDKDSTGAKMSAFGFTPGAVSSGDLGAIGDNLQNWLGVPYFDENGGVYDRYLDEEYLLWIETLGTAYSEGLISEESFTLAQEDVNSKLRNGNYFAYFSSGVANDVSHLSAYELAYPSEKYIVVDGFRSPSGKEHEFPTSSYNGWLVTYVSKDSVDPQSAFYMMEYLLTPEGQKASVCGVEGVTYTWDENTNTCTPSEMYIEENENNPDKYKNIGTGYLYPMTQDGQEFGLMQVGDPAKEQHLWSTNYATEPVLLYSQTDPLPGTNEARNWETFKIQRAEIFARMISTGDIETEINNYETLKETYSIDDINEYRLEQYEIKKSLIE